MFYDFTSPDYLIEKISAFTITFVHLTHLFGYIFPSDLRDSSPIYMWVFNLPIHMILFPSLVATSYCTYSYDTTQDWILAPWVHNIPAHGLPYEQFWICAFIGNMLKDFIVDSMPMVYVMHHILAITAAVLFLSTDTPPIIFCIGCTLIELGSATHTLWVIFPDRFDTLYKYGMTLSNSSALALLLYYIYHSMHSMYLVSLSLIGLTFIFSRQYYLVYTS
jgi:hypothetical protein